MNHWHKGDEQEPMPNVLNRFRPPSWAPAGQEGMEVNVRLGASDLYEERFSLYWLVTAWSMFFFNILSMLVVITAMSWSTAVYVWLPHLAGTAIIDCGIAFMAIIYRFILFPAPGYYTRYMPDMSTMPNMREERTYAPSTSPFTPAHTGPGQPAGVSSVGGNGAAQQGVAA